MKTSNLVKAKLMEIHEVQRLQLRLMELSTFNNFDGFKVVKDLLDNRSLWDACIMDREGSYSTDKSGFIDLIKLRDMNKVEVDRLGSHYNVDTLYILPSEDKTANFKLLKLAASWKADEIDFIDQKAAGMLLGGGGDRPVFRIWWN